MPTTKRIDGDYTITTLNPSDNVIIDTHTVSVQGNLDVSGNLTYINVTELNIRDPFILLNSSNTSSYAANSGVLTHITSSSFAGIRYNSTSGDWEISNNTSTTGETGTWDVIATATSTAAAGANTEIQFNNSGVFGASANLFFDSSLNRVGLQGYQTFGNIGTAPASAANTVAVYHNQIGSGGSGLYVRTPAVQDELASVTKAKLYAIIF
jgi:hypothetical protein